MDDNVLSEINVDDILGSLKSTRIDEVVENEYTKITTFPIDKSEIQKLYSLVECDYIDIIMTKGFTFFATSSTKDVSVIKGKTKENLAGSFAIVTYENEYSSVEATEMLTMRVNAREFANIIEDGTASIFKGKDFIFDLCDNETLESFLTLNAPRQGVITDIYTTLLDLDMTTKGRDISLEGVREIARLNLKPDSSTGSSVVVNVYKGLATININGSSFFKKVEGDSLRIEPKFLKRLNNFLTIKAYKNYLVGIKDNLVYYCPNESASEFKDGAFMKNMMNSAPNIAKCDLKGIVELMNKSKIRTDSVSIDLDDEVGYIKSGSFTYKCPLGNIVRAKGECKQTLRLPSALVILILTKYKDLLTEANLFFGDKVCMITTDSFGLMFKLLKDK